MSLNTIISSIEQRFLDNWTGTDTDTNVRFSNTIFDPIQDEHWVSLDVKWMTTMKSSISTTISKRRRGLIVIDVFAPIDDGTGELGTLADEAISIFEDAQFSVPLDATATYIQCYSADIRHTGVPNIQGTDPQWYKYSVRIKFYRDE